MRKIYADVKANIIDGRIVVVAQTTNNVNNETDVCIIDGSRVVFEYTFDNDDQYLAAHCTPDIVYEYYSKHMSHFKCLSVYIDETYGPSGKSAYYDQI